MKLFMCLKTIEINFDSNLRYHQVDLLAREAPMVASTKALTLLAKNLNFYYSDNTQKRLYAEFSSLFGAEVATDFTKHRMA